MSWRQRILRISVFFLLALSSFPHVPGAPAWLHGSAPAYAAGITLQNVATDFNNPIGVDYHAPTNSLILSVNYPTGTPNSFDLVHPDGSHTPFSTVSGLTDEVYIAAARTTADGFTAGEAFTGNGQPGQILKMSADGLTVTDPWVNLNAEFGETGLLRGALTIDRTGEWGGDLIVATTNGNVYRINGSGAASFLGTANHTIEGLVTVPNNPARYGPWAGKLLTGSDANLLYTFTQTGFDQAWDLGIFGGSENLYIPSVGDSFYGVDFADHTLVTGSSAAFAPYVGDVIAGDENGNLFDLRWSGGGTAFNNTLLAHVGQFEGATFAPVSLVTVPPPDAPIAGSPTTASLTEGVSSTVVVATFTDPDSASLASEYAATIDWGDSSTSAGTVSGSGGNFSVSGSHAYADEGAYTVTVVITDKDNASNTATVKSTATVVDASLSANGLGTIVSPLAFAGTVANLTDANAGATAADFTATINWGDSTSSVGAVSGSAGSFSVSGSHAYGATGYFTVTVTITDDGGSTASAQTRVLIVGTVAGGNFVIGDQSAAVGATVTFWGAQWHKQNSLSGGAAPASFKGFEDSPAAPGCGTNWTTDPGNSTPPPAGPLPAYMAVIVSSSVSQSGSTISGNTVQVVVVQTSAGYGPNPGHAGTGTVVATVCP